MAALVESGDIFNLEGAVHIAVIFGIYWAVPMLNARGANFSEENDGFNVMHVAAPSDRVKSITALQECGVNISIRAADGLTTFHIAAAC